jgi:protein-S-isoprenylcysteine O-methyltransferase Ste14
MNAKLSARRPYSGFVVRLALGLVFAVLAGACLKSGISGLRRISFDNLRLHQIGQILSVLTIGFYTLVIACLYVLRLRPVSKFMGALPCATAILGGFLLSALLLLPSREDLPLWALLFSDLLVVVGNTFAITILLQLGRSFSILPEGRRMVTRGFYSVVRHPLYLAEAVATLGVAINFLSAWALILVAMQFALQITRIHYEEKVLKEHFPEYGDYARKTWRLIPGVY